jgi:hypothetical protein
MSGETYTSAEVCAIDVERAHTEGLRRQVRELFPLMRLAADKLFNTEYTFDVRQGSVEIKSKSLRRRLVLSIASRELRLEKQLLVDTKTGTWKSFTHIGLADITSELTRLSEGTKSNGSQ